MIMIIYRKKPLEIVYYLPFDRIKKQYFDVYHNYSCRYSFRSFNPLLYYKVSNPIPIKQSSL